MTIDFYHHCRLIWFHNLCFPFRADHNLPYILQWRLLIVVGDCEEGTIPSRHAIWLLVSVDQVVEEILGVAPILIFVLQ